MGPVPSAAGLKLGKRSDHHTRVAVNDEDDSGSYTVGNGRSVDDENGEFIVGNGKEDTSISEGKADSLLYLVLENLEDLSEIEDIYIVGEAKTSLQYLLTESQNTIKITAESLKQRTEDTISLLITSDNKGAKLGPFKIQSDKEGSGSTLKVPMQPLQTVSGYIGQYSGEKIGFAGTKLKAKVDESGFYEVSGVPVGSHNFLIANDREKVYIPLNVDNNQENKMFNLQSQVSINELCAGLGKEENIKINFKNEPIMPYVRMSEDTSNDFKNKYRFASVSKYSINDDSTKYICDIEITIHPKKADFKYSNDLAIMLNNNLLYTHLVEEDENKGVLEGLNFIEILGNFVEGIVEGIAGILRGLQGIPEEIRPLKIGINNFNQPLLIYNAFKTNGAFDLEVLCLKSTEECQSGISHVSVELSLIKE
ncbi:MAG: hypothetical protein HRU09_18255 [Oligoflexales bacterium]|nr:hypothetical protein [Oligoflexales bacterium]